MGSIIDDDDDDDDDNDNDNNNNNVVVIIIIVINQQLLGKAEYDVKNYGDQGGCYSPRLRLVTPSEIFVIL